MRTELVDLAPDETVDPFAVQVAEAEGINPATLTVEPLVVLALACEGKVVHVVLHAEAAGLLAVEIADRVTSMLGG